VARAKRARPTPARAPAGDLGTLTKALAVLGCFTPERRRLSLAAIIAATGLPRATAHRFLRALAAEGLLDQDQARGEYRLGLRLFALGSIALANLDLHREAGAAIDRLTRLSGESVHLALFDGFNVVVIARKDSDASRRSVVTEIEQAPAHCTAVGKAVLAFQPTEVVARLCASGLPRFTPTTLSDPAALRAALQLVARRGYAIDDGEHRPGVRCIGAPIRDAGGRVFAAISVTGAAARMTGKRATALAPLVVDAADAISRRLGWRAEG
jgi:DNA-binding IclR family transcriptional regulator